MRVLIRPDWASDFTMKRIRHTAEQIIRKLKTAEQLIAQGKTVADVCRAIEVTKPNTPIRSGPWISSSTAPLTAAGSNFST